MAPAGRISRPVLLARRWATAAASAANDSSSASMAAASAARSASATLTSTCSCSSSVRPQNPFFSSPSRSFASLPAFEEDVGQPTHETHPEVLAPGELAPGITPLEVSSRREALAARMEQAASAAASNSYFTRTRNSAAGGLNLAVVPSPLPVMMAGVIPYPYRPEPDFYYLTGVAQPGCVAVVVAEEGGGGGGGGEGIGVAEDEESGRILSAAATKKSSRRRRRKQHRFILFVPDECARTRLWDGGRLSVEAARRVFGADEAFPMSQLQSRLAPLLSAASLVLCDADRSAGADPRYSALVEEQLLMLPPRAEAGGGGERGGGKGDATAASKVQPLRPHAHALRWIKSDAELALMRRSAEMAAAGMRAAMAASNLTKRSSGGESGESVSERALAATFEAEVKLRGADRLAYPPVVAGGARACTIHYSRNDRLLRAGEWLLMDAGCEFWGYASDVSRAWPVVDDSGLSSASPAAAASLFSSPGPHSDVYHALLEVHSKCVAAAVPGNSLSEIHALSVALLADAAAQLGGAGVKNPESAVPALRGMSAAEIAGRGGRQGPLSLVFPHAVGHWLGLDTHDAPLGGAESGAGAALVPNVVLTIEPGLYFPADASRWGRLAGVGMRLEDDVAVGRTTLAGSSSSSCTSSRSSSSSSSSSSAAGAAGARAGAGAGAGAGEGGEGAGRGRGGGPEVLSASAPLLPAEVAAAIDGGGGGAA